MDKSTEINSLPMSENNQGDSNDLVNKIIDEIKNNEESAGMEMNIQESQPNFQGQGQGQGMPPMYDPSVPMGGQDSAPMDVPLPPHMRQLVDQDYMNIPKGDSNGGMCGGLLSLDKLKMAAVVFVLLFLLLLPIGDKYISKLLPSLYVNNNSLSYLGVFVKTLIGTILFYTSTLV